MWVSWLGLFGVLVGAVLGFVQYFDRVEESQVAKTLGFVERSYSPIMRKILEAVDDLWFTRTSEINELWAQPGKTQQQLDAQWNTYVVTTIRKTENESNVRHLLGFYEELAICVKRNICHHDTTFDVFGKAVITFYNQNRPYIDFLRKKLHNPRIAHNVAVFTEEYGKFRRAEDQPK